MQRLAGLVLGLALAACGSGSGSAGTPPGQGSGGGVPPVQVTLTLHVTGPGTVVASAQSVECQATCQATVAIGTAIHLVATPDAGAQLSAWSGACSGAAGCDLILTQDLQVGATFVATPPPARVTLTVSLVGAGTGRVTSAPAGIDCPGTCSMSVNSGAAVTLTAAQNAGSTFAGWSNTCAGKVACAVTPSTDTAISAQFDTTQVGPPPDDCAGLVPASPGAPSARHTTRPDRFLSNLFCQPGFVDGDGTLVLDLWDGRPGFGHNLNFVSPSGVTLGADSGGQSRWAEQVDGFLAGNISYPDWFVTRYDSHGQQTAQGANVPSGGGMAVDPTGGAVIPKAGNPITGAAVSLELFAYDAHATLRWHVTLPAERLGAFAVDRAGNTLLVIDGDDRYGPNTIAGIWVDHGGVAGPEFLLHRALASGQPAHILTFTLAERVGSGLFVGAEGHWLLEVDALSTSPSAPPGWLAARPLSPMHVVHGGAGYAVLPNPANGDCAQTIDVVSPSGKTCGSRTFRAAAGSCQTGTIRVGYDGTVVQGLPAPITCSSASCSCTWQWWSGFFR